MYRFCYAPLFCTLLILTSTLWGQDSLTNSIQLEEIQRMIDETSSQFDIQMAKASIGEIQLDEGLWLRTEEAAYGGELLAFDAISRQEGVEIIWTTAIEYQSEYFAIERIQPDQQFAIISIVEAAGFSRGIRTYRFIDKRPFTEHCIYRLCQVDRNGVQHLSHPIEIHLEEDGFLTVRTSENDLNLDIQTDIKMVRISITDQKGKVVVQTEQEDDSFTRIDIGKLKPGQYAVKVEDGDQVRMMEFEKKK